MERLHCGFLTILAAFLTASIAVTVVRRQRTPQAVLHTPENVTVGTLKIKGVTSTMRRLSELESELAPAEVYKMMFKNTWYCTDSDNTGTYPAPIDCQNPFKVGEAYDPVYYDLAQAEVELTNMDVSSDQSFNFIMIEMSRVVRVKGSSASCCTAASSGDNTNFYSTLRFANSTTPCDSVESEAVFFTDGNVSLCLDTTCTDKSYVINIQKDPSFDTDIVGLEQLLDDQETVKIIIKSNTPFKLDSNMFLVMDLENALSFEIVSGVCNVGPYYIKLTLN